MKTLLLTALIAASSFNCNAKFYDMNRHEMPAPKQLKMLPHTPYFMDEHHNYYAYRPMVKGTLFDTTCMFGEDMNSDELLAQVKKEGCNLQLEGHSKAEADKFDEWWNDEFLKAAHISYKAKKH